MNFIIFCLICGSPFIIVAIISFFQLQYDKQYPFGFTKVIKDEYGFYRLMKWEKIKPQIMNGLDLKDAVGK